MIFFRGRAHNHFFISTGRKPWFLCWNSVYMSSCDRRQSFYLSIVEVGGDLGRSDRFIHDVKCDYQRPWSALLFIRPLHLCSRIKCVCEQENCLLFHTTVCLSICQGPNHPIVGTHYSLLRGVFSTTRLTVFSVLGMHEIRIITRILEKISENLFLFNFHETMKNNFRWPLLDTRTKWSAFCKNVLWLTSLLWSSGPMFACEINRKQH